MISEMPGPIGVRISGIVGGRWEIVLGKKKKIKNFAIENGLKKMGTATKPYLFSACVITLLALRTDALRHIYLI